MTGPVPNAELIKHAYFCLPRPGLTEPRLESFHRDRTGDDGTTVIARPRVTRCLECAEQFVEG